MACLRWTNTFCQIQKLSSNIRNERESLLHLNRTTNSTSTLAISHNSTGNSGSILGTISNLCFALTLRDWISSYVHSELRYLISSRKKRIERQSTGNLMEVVTRRRTLFMKRHHPPHLQKPTYAHLHRWMWRLKKTGARRSEGSLPRGDKEEMR